MTIAALTPLPCLEHRGLLRFTVDVDERQISAFLSERVWQARYAHGVGGESLTERYRSQRTMIDAAVARRVQSGAREPVVLRSGDL